MPRWYALCNGHDLPACNTCRRLADLYPTAREHNQQAWITPDFTATHCNSYIERPDYLVAPTPPLKAEA